MNTRPFIVIGGGGHAKVVIATLRRSGHPVLGVCDIDDTRASDLVLDVPVLGDDSSLEMHDSGEIQLAMGIGSTGRPATRRSVFERLQAAGYAFTPICDETAVIGDRVTLNQGAQILSGAVIQPDTRIGANVIVNTQASVDHDCIIGDHVHIAPGATICGGVRVGDGSHVGAGAVVIQELSIGAECVVGAGSVVLADVPDGQTVVGNPAREVS